MRKGENMATGTMRLARITWKPTATIEDRRACGAYLRARGLLPIPIVAKQKGEPTYAWAIKRSIDEQGAAK